MAFSVDDFTRLALAEFGDDAELREDFAEYHDVPYLQMTSLATLMRRAKGAADWTTCRRAVALVDRLGGDPDDTLRNALDVSLLEHLDFDGAHGPKARSLLTPRLQAGWRAMDAYNRGLGAGAKGPPPS